MCVMSLLRKGGLCVYVWMSMCVYVCICVDVCGEVGHYYIIL